MNRNSLAREIAKATGLSNKKALGLVIAFGNSVAHELSKGKKIVYSNFGTFYTVHYPSKIIFHPKLGLKKKMIMLPTNVMKWMPAKNIKEMVDKEMEVSEPTKHKARKSGSIYPEPEKKVEEIAKDKVEKSETGEPQDIPVSKETTKKPVNIYEEMFKDGSSELSTIDGTIKAHHDIASDKGDRSGKSEKSDEDEATDIDTTAGKPKGAFAALKDRMSFFKKNDTPPPSSDNDKSDVKKPESDNDSDSKNIEAEHDKNMADTGIFAAESFRDQPASAHKNAGEQRINEIKSELDKGANESKKSEEDLPAFDIKRDATQSSVPATRDETKITYQDLSKTTVSKELFSRVPENIARRFQAVPIDDAEDLVTVAMVDPQDIESKETLKRLLGSNIKIVLATESDINHVLGQYQGLESEVNSAIESAEAKEDEEKDKKENDKKGDKKELEIPTDDAPAARIVNSLLKRAIRDKASDIHIEPTENKVEVRFRIDGILRLKVELPKDIQSAVTSRVKILSNLKIDEQRIPQDGRFNMTVDQRRVDFRVSTMPVANGEKIVMRILDKETGILTIEQLGIRGSGLITLTDNIGISHGMILVTGPTGSGKSTTLYAMISKIYSEGINIVTLEDPIEYQIKGINQSQVNSEIGYTFANGLRSILRQDPDVVMIGEIRDKETAEMAVHAALTGHVVLSTLHTNDAAGAIPRMIDMGVEPFLLSSSLNVIIAQRLVRKLCSDCKEEIKLSALEEKIVKGEIEKMPEAEKAEATKKGMKFYKGKGCKNCDNSGYKGRIGIYEVLSVSNKVKEEIVEKSTGNAINETAISEGMVTLLQDGILKAIDGVTTMEEVWRVTKE
jgi:type IV pilus assembly protein PilB